MFIGQSVYVRHEGTVRIGKVEIIWEEDLKIKLDTGELITRKFWEIRKVEKEND
jgi:hypothetical protein